MERHAVERSLQKETKSNRLVKACDTCRQKKTRCELKDDGCLYCFTRAKSCTFTPIKTNRGPRRPPRYKYITDLEGRIKTLEVKLQAQGPSLGVRDITKITQDLQPGNVIKNSNSSLATCSSSEMSHCQLQLWRKACVPSVNDMSCSLTSCNVHGILTSERTLDPSLQLPRSVVNNPQFLLRPWNITTMSSLDTRQKLKHLPPKHEASLLIQEAFYSFNSAFPLFDQTLFMNAFESRYNDESNAHKDPGWWACLNVIFALAHRYRAMRMLNSLSEDCHAWGYIQNALSTFSALTMIRSEISAIQAAIGMTIVLQGTPSPQHCPMLIATALKLAQTLRLHRQEQEAGLSPAELEQRRRIFWIAYLLDKDISLRTRQPPAQDDDDMDVDLPIETVMEPASDSGINHFNLRIGLAIIQGQIYKRLCSVKALQQSESERLMAAKELNTLLDNWQQCNPIEFHYDRAYLSLAVTSQLTLIHSVVTMSIYFNALDIVRRSLLPDSSTGNKLTGSTSLLDCGKLSFPNDTVRTGQARKSLQLLEIMPKGNYACVWLTLQSFISASKTLLMAIISDSIDSIAGRDLELVQGFLEVLEVLQEERKPLELQNIEESLRTLWVTARSTVKNKRA